MSSSLSATSGSNSSSGMKSWVHCHDLHPSVSGVKLTAAKPVFAGATDSSSTESRRSVLGDASEGLLLASARSSSCSRCWRLLSLGAMKFVTTIESFDRSLDVPVLLVTKLGVVIRKLCNPKMSELRTPGL